MKDTLPAPKRPEGQSNEQAWIRHFQQEIDDTRDALIMWMGITLSLSIVSLTLAIVKIMEG